MRHFYFRIGIGVIWFIVAAINAASGNLPFTVFNAVIGVIFLYSAYTIWKNTRG